MILISVLFASSITSIGFSFLYSLCAKPNPAPRLPNGGYLEYFTIFNASFWSFTIGIIIPFAPKSKDLAI